MIPNPIPANNQIPFVTKPMWRYKLSVDDLCVIKMALQNLHFPKRHPMLQGLEDARKRLLKKMEKRDFFVVLYFEHKEDGVEPPPKPPAHINPIET